MNDLFDSAQVATLFKKLLTYVESITRDPHLWIQLVVIVAVFIVARWFFAPLLKRYLTRLAGSTTLPNFRRPLLALSTVASPIAWLILQWVAMGVADYLAWPSHALTIVASLLSAWVLIRLASMLVANEELANVIAMSAWTIAALNIFGWLDPVTNLLDSWAIHLGQVRVSPLSVLKIALSVWFALWLANGLSSLVERRLARSQFFAPAVKVLAAKLSRIGLITVALLIAISAAGVDLTALAVFTGALGVGLGFGLQKIFSNLVSGVILLMDRSIKPGDVIAVGTTFGWINHLGARYVSVITRDGIEHLIPNEELITQRVENWSYSNKLVRLRIPVSISYRSDPRQAMELCREAAEMVPRILLDPEPKIQLIGFGDSSVNLEIRVWIEDPESGRGNVISELLLGIWDRFHEEGIEIPYPQRDLHIKTLPDNDRIRSAIANSGQMEENKV